MGEARKDKDYEIDLAECMGIFLRNKKTIAAVTMAFAISSIIVSLVLPPIYRAETKILPPQQGSSGMAAQLLNQLGGIASLGALGLGAAFKTPGEMYIGMLKSRTVYDRIIDTFNLEKVYDVKYKEDARRELDDAIDSKIKDGIITLRVEDKDPKRAAAMANAFVDELIGLTKGLAVTEAEQRKLFFEEQLAGVKVALTKSEEELRLFQEKTGALKIDEQARAVIGGMARLRAQIAAKEVQQKVMLAYATPQNPDVQRVQEELKGLQDELNKMEAKKGSGHDPLMSTGRMPSVGSEYIRKFRDFKYSETLFELLAKQYELAKLDEAKGAVVFQVIDKAVTPERRAKPRRILIVSIATFTGFILTLLGVLLREYLRPILSARDGGDKASPSSGGGTQTE